MDNKPSKTKQKKAWECRYGCDVRFELCKHLNAYLNKRHYDEPYRSKTFALEDFPNLTKEPEQSRESKAASFRRFLLKFGLSKAEREFLLCKFAYDYTYENLALEFNFVSATAAWRYTKHLVDRVRVKILLERQNEKTKRP